MSDAFKEGDTQLGSFYPRHCVVAVMPDDPAAELAAEQLRSHGFEPGDLRVWHNDDLLADEPAFRGHRGLLQKIGAVLSDEDTWMEEYREHARAGHPLLTVYAGNAYRAAEIRDRIESLGARSMRYYGSAVLVTDLVTEAPPRRR